MIEAIKRRLRGRHNSIRYKYGVLPKEWLIYLFRYRALGNSWVDFYAQRLDGHANTASEKPPSDKYLEIGAQHFEYLKKCGLKPDHALLDFGCGVLRLGAYAARYLEPGNYVGVDISQKRLDRGTTVMAAAGIPETSYEAICVSGCELEEISGRRFDAVWAQSVLTHMPENDIRTMLWAIKPMMKPDAFYLFTFAPGEKRRRMNIKDFWYPVDDIRQIVESEGFNFEIMSDWPGVGDAMARITLGKEPAA